MTKTSKDEFTPEENRIFSCAARARYYLTSVEWDTTKKNLNPEEYVKYRRKLNLIIESFESEIQNLIAERK